MKKIDIVVTGAGGQLGREFRHLSSLFPDWHFVWADSAALDVSDEAAVQRFFEQYPACWYINCAAYTAVDKAETEPKQCYQVNTLAPKLLAEACRSTNARLVHFSTDYVFHTAQNRPFREDDPTCTRGVYALSKRLGEDAIMGIYPTGSTIIRTSWVYAQWGHNFVNTMLRLGRERASLNVVYDQVGSPTYARHLAMAVLRAIQAEQAGQVPPNTLNGIFHYSNEGVASWYDFALAIFELAGINCKVQPILTSAYPTPAQRPPYSVLDKSKWKQIFGQEIAHWREALKQCLAQQ